MTHVCPYRLGTPDINIRQHFNAMVVVKASVSAVRDISKGLDQQERERERERARKRERETGDRAIERES